jgi:ABC-type glycerol-3-phosphate transport system substrate-binding protein
MTIDLNQFADSTLTRYSVDGFGVQYCYPFAWKANLWVRNKIVDIVPVPWADSITKVGQDIHLWVSFKKAEEAELHNSGEPFYVAVAWDKGEAGKQRVFDSFYAVYLVERLKGTIDTNNNCSSIEVKVLGKRVAAIDYVAAPKRSSFLS